MKKVEPKPEDWSEQAASGQRSLEGLVYPGGVWRLKYVYRVQWEDKRRGYLIMQPYSARQRVGLQGKKQIKFLLLTSERSSWI